MLYRVLTLRFFSPEIHALISFRSQCLQYETFFVHCVWVHLAKKQLQCCFLATCPPLVLDFNTGSYHVDLDTFIFIIIMRYQKLNCCSVSHEFSIPHTLHGAFWYWTPCINTWQVYDLPQNLTHWVAKQPKWARFQSKQILEKILPILLK